MRRIRTWVGLSSIPWNARLKINVYSLYMKVLETGFRTKSYFGERLIRAHYSVSTRYFSEVSFLRKRALGTVVDCLRHLMDQSQLEGYVVFVMSRPEQDAVVHSLPLIFHSNGTPNEMWNISKSIKPIKQTLFKISYKELYPAQRTTDIHSVIKNRYKKYNMIWFRPFYRKL